MEIILAIIIGLMYDKIINSKLAQGKYLFKETIFGFGVFGESIIFAVSAWYIPYKFSTDTSKNGFYTFGALKAGLIPIAAYSYCIILGV